MSEDTKTRGGNSPIPSGAATPAGGGGQSSIKSRIKQAGTDLKKTVKKPFSALNRLVRPKRGEGSGEGHDTGPGGTTAPSGADVGGALADPTGLGTVTPQSGTDQELGITEYGVELSESQGIEAISDEGPAHTGSNTPLYQDLASALSHLLRSTKSERCIIDGRCQSVNSAAPLPTLGQLEDSVLNATKPLTMTNIVAPTLNPTEGHEHPGLHSPLGPFSPSTLSPSFDGLSLSDGYSVQENSMFNSNDKNMQIPSLDFTAPSFYTTHPALSLVIPPPSSADDSELMKDIFQFDDADPSFRAIEQSLSSPYQLPMTETLPAEPNLQRIPRNAAHNRGFSVAGTSWTGPNTASTHLSSPSLCFTPSEYNSSALLSPPTPYGEAKFVCEWCQQTFTTNHNLKNHRNVHLGIKEHSCSRCHREFTTQSVLARHMKTCKAPGL
ncbi:hypothetical protein H1R20_g7834, partial [Candolleomyces eurysporus]